MSRSHYNDSVILYYLRSARNSLTILTMVCCSECLVRHGDILYTACCYGQRVSLYGLYFAKNIAEEYGPHSTLAVP